ncbi:protein kinase family protein [Rhizobium ruizarguesonis]|uniref:hypothetical protein n=1 Tax=Rhizobium ruizarguesonis TaxID=2081791 RepID=UPI0010300D4C|nr:hypothetical protein [Rhizobium ruizarguesonis]TAT71086.1 hypothetical protein ELI52_36635 [Rhizobium ruizarguesonis]
MFDQIWINRTVASMLLDADGISRNFLGKLKYSAFIKFVSVATFRLHQREHALMNARRSKKPNFLSGFQMAEDTLLEPDTSTGRPGIWPGVDEDGHNILVKFWPAQSARIDRDLEEIWRSEIRQLHTLGALPEANDLIVRMTANGRDSSGFYLVLDAGEGVPLAIASRRKTLPKLLATSRTPQTRAVLWQNFRRVIRGLDLLHSQGAIHRNIDPWSVISNFSAEPDFRLTGFEWSMGSVRLRNT